MTGTPSSTASRTAVVNGRRVYLLKVARFQRTLIVLVLALLACSIAAPVSIPLSESIGLPGPDAYSLAASIFLYGSYVLIPLGIIQTVRLSIAAGENAVLTVFCGLLMLIPVIGPLVLLVVNTSATALLQKNGVSVGFFGVTASQMRTLVLGACPGCGYDIRGLPAPMCPECGFDLPPERS